jgi:hypothetical protein
LQTPPLSPLLSLLVSLTQPLPSIIDQQQFVLSFRPHTVMDSFRKKRWWGDWSSSLRSLETLGQMVSTGAVKWWEGGGREREIIVDMVG